jgi:DNA ligase-associated metallophosphoesterase
MTQKQSPLSSPASRENQNIRIDIAEGETLPGDADIVLLPGRAAFLPKTSTVVCSDIHLGKAATFRHAGMPVPEGSAQHDLKRLSQIIQFCKAQRLVITGDLFHARSGCTPQVLDEFSSFCQQVRALHDTQVTLVVGNHEQSLGKRFRPYEIGIDRCEKEIIELPFRFVHNQPIEHDDRATYFTIAGHIHPTITIKSPSGDRMTCRCFVATDAALILPAFGSFTGGHNVKTSHRTRLWLAQPDGVAAATPALMRANHNPEN